MFLLTRFDLNLKLVSKFNLSKKYTTADTEVFYLVEFEHLGKLENGCSQLELADHGTLSIFFFALSQSLTVKTSSLP